MLMSEPKKEPSRKVIENSSTTGKENNSGNSKQISNLTEKLNKLQGALNQFATTSEVSRLKNNLE